MAIDLAKYGAKPATETQSSTIDLSKYGATPIAPTSTTKAAPELFGHPLRDVNAAGEEIHAAITGQGEFAGRSSFDRDTSAAAAAARAVPTVISDLIPGGSQALQSVSQIFKGGIDFAGGISHKLADVAQKIGVMSPEQRRMFDENNGDLLNTPEGIAIQSVARIGQNFGDIANTILMAHGLARGTQDFIDNKVPRIQAQIKENADYKARQADATAIANEQSLINKTANEIANVENKYVQGRNANAFSKDGGISSRLRISQSNVLKNSVDESGLLRTTQKGGAADRYRAMTTDPMEGVVRANLVREGSKVNIRNVQSVLETKIRNSGLQGADLVNALNGIKKEVAGLRLKADSLGYLETTLLHDAKINTTSNINYQTLPEIAKARKALANGYKTLVEENTHTFDVRAVNKELAKYYEDIGRLEQLDGARVTGGKLGKYTAQISGNIVGGAFGSILGPVGAAMGTVIGGEVAGAIKGKAMSKTFGGREGGSVPKNQILEKAKTLSESPRPMLPAGNGVRSSKPSGKTIILPRKSGL